MFLSYHHWICCKPSSFLVHFVPQSPMYDGKVPHWHHFSCFWQRAAVHSVADIAGFADLRWADQDKVKKAIDSGGAVGGSCTEMQFIHVPFVTFGSHWMISCCFKMCYIFSVSWKRRPERRSKRWEDAERLFGGVCQVEPQHMQRLPTENRKGEQRLTSPK